MFVRHQVADYPAWRSVYDSIDETRASMGRDRPRRVPLDWFTTAA
jgi:hypothetical protein